MTTMNTSTISVSNQGQRRNRTRRSNRRSNQRGNHNQNHNSSNTNRNKHQNNNQNRRDKEDSVTKLQRQNKERQCEHGIITRHFDAFTNYTYTYSDLLACKIDTSPRYPDGHAIYCEFAFSRYVDDIDITTHFEEFDRAISTDYPLFTSIMKHMTRIKSNNYVDDECVMISFSLNSMCINECASMNIKLITHMSAPIETQQRKTIIAKNM
eukprot:222825_1